jgi:hypothetical protein
MRKCIQIMNIAYTYSLHYWMKVDAWITFDSFQLVPIAKEKGRRQNERERERERERE